jgi:cAMP phosphodiesterase
MASCGKAERPPEDILTTDEMVAVMAELYIAEQKISTLGISRDSLRHVFGAMEEEIFDKMNTKDSVFRKSLDYYMARPRTLEHIYTALIDSLNLREQRISTGDRPR